MSAREQVFLLSVAIIEGRHFAIPSMDSAVLARVGNQKKSTKILYSTENPYFNEYFVFEMNTTLDQLLDLNIVLTVIQPCTIWRSRKILGTFIMDVATIWSQSDHIFYHKWAVLNKATKESLGPQGYLKVDISVLAAGEVPKIPTIHNDNDEIEGNLLLPEGALAERHLAHFLFSVYRAEGLTTTKGALKKAHCSLESEMAPSSYIQISFAGLQEKTTIRKHNHNPVWEEKLVLSHLFPLLCQRIKIELKYTGQNAPKATHYINFKHISNSKVNGHLPVFGPAFIHFYSDNHYCGKLLMSMQTQILGKLSGAPRIKVRDAIQPLKESWETNTIYLFAALFSANLISKTHTGKQVHFEISIGNSLYNTRKGSASSALTSVPDNLGMYCYLPIEEEKPCLYALSEWPDHRRRLFNSNIISNACASLRSQVEEIQKQIESHSLMTDKLKYERLALEVLRKLKVQCKSILNYSKSFPAETKLDTYRLDVCRDEIKYIITRANVLHAHQNKKKIFGFLKKSLLLLENISENPQECWPDVFVWMYINNKRVAYYRIPTKHIVYSSNNFERGSSCGVVQDVYFKPLEVSKKKFQSGFKATMECKAEMMLWIGLESDQKKCFKMLPLSFHSEDLEHIVQWKNLITSKEKNNFACNIYIYQGRFIPGADESGLADPYIRFIVNHFVVETTVQNETLNPVWDQTLHIPSVTMYNSVEYIKNNPPAIICECFDKDPGNKSDFLGRCFLKPIVTLKHDGKAPVKLQWIKVFNDLEKFIGELLLAAEFVQNGDKPDEKPTDVVPCDIRPNLTKFRIEIIFWGVRDLKKIRLRQINKPKITIECGGQTIESTTLANTKKNLNFSLPYKTIDIDLPEENEYLPPMSIKMYESMGFGRFSVVGVAEITEIYKFLCRSILREERVRPAKVKPLASNTYSLSSSDNYSLTESDIQQHETLSFFHKLLQKFCLNCFIKKKKLKEVKKMIEPEEFCMPEEDIDWWSKFHLTMQDEKKYSQDKSTDLIDEKYKLKIYHNELEHQPEFKGFNDQLTTFELYHGKRTGDDIIDEGKIRAVFKGAIKLYRVTPSVESGAQVTEYGHAVRDGALSAFPGNGPLGFVIRIYVIRGLNLRPMDLNGKSDPYVEITMGDRYISDVEHFIPNQVNPVFGRCFELKGSFPEHHMVKIAIWDYDRTSSNDLIGRTKIDIENRLFTKYRAHCGLSNNYNETGNCFWRDQQKPSEILELLCKKYNIESPIFDKNTVKIGYTVFTNTEPATDTMQKEVLSLLALKRWHEIPVIGFHLVPEHVETRSLYNPHIPGVEQGKIQLWVDVFPCSDLPPPNIVDITPKQAIEYELRVVIWNTEDVLLLDDDFFLGEKKSDIYVKGWLTGPENSQYTDVHYNSLTGEGNFNWRFIFPFHYLSIENKMVLHTKSLFSSSVTEEKIPCILHLQVWDNDTFTPDDFIGTLQLELSRLPRGAKTQKKCKMDILGPKASRVNLFKTKRHRGFWPVVGNVGKSNKLAVTGKIEAEIQILTAKEAKALPAGLGRHEPQKLADPVRPEIAFSWFSNPLKGLKFMWHRVRWKLCGFFCVLMIIFMVVMTVYRIPEIILKKFIGLIL